MKDLSIAEAYFLCAVENKGKLYSYDTVKISCLIASVLWEMERLGIAALSEKKVTLLPGTFQPPSHLLPAYEHLREMDELDYKCILQDYTSGWSDRHLNALTAAIGEGLTDRGLVTKAKLGIFGGRTFFMPSRNALPALMAEVQVDILFQTPASTEDILLWTLLGRSGCIPDILDGELRAAICARTAEAKQSDTDGTLTAFQALLDRLPS